VYAVVVHYDFAKSFMHRVMENKPDKQLMVIYAPHKEGFIEKKLVERLNEERYVVITNMRGRLLNDIFVSLMTAKF